MKKPKIRNLSRRGKIMLTTLVALMFIGVATAALLPHFGKITTTATVSQSVWVDGLQYPDSEITETIDGAGGDTVCTAHWLENKASVPIDVEFENWNNSEGAITTTYMKRVPYSFDMTVRGYAFGGAQDPTAGIHMVVEEVGNWIQWTYTYPEVLQAACVNIDYPLRDTGKEICIHNNDGHDPLHDWGTWLYNPDGEQVGSGNTPVDELYWVQAEGERGVDDTYVVRILKSVINYDFHWHATYTPVGGPMYMTNYNGVTYNNFYEADLWQELTTPFTLQSGERLDFVICHNFHVRAQAGTYTIVTTITSPE